MNLIVPIEVTADKLTTNVAETEYPAWSSSTDYTSGNLVQYEHKIYKALVSNTNVLPTNTNTWVYVSYTNPFRMFDKENSSKTTNSTVIDVTIAPSIYDGIVNSIAILEVTANSVQITVTDATDGVVYDKTFSLINYSNVLNIYDYFFEPINLVNQSLTIDLPNYVGADIRIQIFGDAVSIGTCLLGKYVKIGCTKYGAGVGITDYSKKEADTFGGFTVVERNYSKRGTFEVVVPTENLDNIVNVFASRRAKPTLYFATQKYKCTIIYGFYKDFSPIISYPTISEMNLEIEGLI